MNCKLIASLLAPFVLVACLMAASEAQPPPGYVFVPSGDGRLIAPAKSKPVPRRKVADYAWEQFIHEATGEVYLREHIRYTNGDVESRVGPDVPEFIPWEFQPQFAPAPLSPTPLSCVNVVQSSTLTGVAQTGRVVFDATIPCMRIGGSSEPCNPIKMTIYVDQIINGDPHPVAFTDNRYSSGCGAAAHPYWEYTLPAHGYYRVKSYGFDLTTNATLWSQTIEFQFTG